MQQLKNASLRVHFYGPKTPLAWLFAWTVGSQYSHVAFEHDGALFEMHFDPKICGWYAVERIHAHRPPSMTIEIHGDFDASALEVPLTGSIPKWDTFQWYWNWWWGGPKFEPQPITCINRTAELLRICGVPIGPQITMTGLIVALLQHGGVIVHKSSDHYRTDRVPRIEAYPSELFAWHARRQEADAREHRFRLWPAVHD